MHTSSNHRPTGRTTRKAKLSWIGGESNHLAVPAPTPTYPVAQMVDVEMAPVERVQGLRNQNQNQQNPPPMQMSSRTSTWFEGQAQLCKSAISKFSLYRNVNAHQPQYIHLYKQPAV